MRYKIIVLGFSAVIYSGNSFNFSTWLINEQKEKNIPSMVEFLIIGRNRSIFNILFSLSMTDHRGLTKSIFYSLISFATSSAYMCHLVVDSVLVHVKHEVL